MKRIVYRATILLPLGLLFYTFMEPMAFCVPEINLYLDLGLSRFLVVMTTVVWLCCSPFRESCCNETCTEFLFNIVPVEITLMVCFAQWKFIASVILALILIACETALFIGLKRNEHKHRLKKKRYRTAFQRFSVFAMFVICMVPCFLSLFVYGLQSPVYRAEQEIRDSIFLDVDSSVDINNDKYYQDNMNLWLCFDEVSWKKGSISAKITIMQKLVDFETTKLGIPSIPVAADMIGECILGAYNKETNEIWINTKYLSKSSVDECIQSILHEVYHAFQCYLIRTLDWGNPALQTEYFVELQSWLKNQENYKDAWDYGFEAYEDQPLETSAREYAEDEALKIMNYVRSVV